MRWTERRTAMLREMGLRVWAPARGEAVVDRPPEAAADVAARVEPSTAPLLRARAPADVGATFDRSAAVPADLDGAVACAACPFRDGRARPADAAGAAVGQADWFVVVEPPGASEGRDGASLGRAGELLDAMLRAVGTVRDAPLAVPASRARVVVPVGCPAARPGATGGGSQAVCGPDLARRIELAAPKVVLAMGRAAPLLLRTDEPLGRLRGQVHRYRGLPLVATYAPAYLLRQPADKARAWDDLCLALEAVRGAP